MSFHHPFFAQCAARLRGLFFACCVSAFTLAHAQVQTVSPDTFSFSVATGGNIVSTVSPIPTNGIGNRAATAQLCSSIAGVQGVSLAPTCTGGATFSSLAVGALPNTGAPQLVNINFTPTQLASFIPILSSAGQAYSNRHFFVMLSYTASALAPPSADRFVTFRVNIIEPPIAGITQATTSLLDVAPFSASPISIRYLVTGIDTPLSGMYCANLNAAYPALGVSNTNPCAPASLMGNAMQATGYINTPQTGEQLIVPETIARQAAARAQASGNSIFYFVRQFSSGKFAVVQLRLNANSASIPLAFTSIRLGFKDGGSLQNIGFFKRGQTLPAVNAALRYTGAGVLRARWEIVQPNDPTPTALDLQAEANLTPLQRAQQQRYRVIDRVSIYLPATGQAVLSGPTPRLLPNEQYGQYLLMLRIEPADGMMGNSPSATAGGSLASAGQAGFALPVLRYYIGESSGPSGQSAAVQSEPQTLQLVLPAAGGNLPIDSPASFSWLEGKGISLYRLEIEANGKPAFSARVRSQAASATSGAATSPLSYTAPPFITSQLQGKAVRWRVIALATDGQFIGSSEWREVANSP